MTDIRRGSDKCQQGTHARLQPTSFDHLVGTSQERLWHAQRSPGLQIDHQLELRGLCDREVGRLVAFENAADVGADLAIRIGEDQACVFLWATSAKAASRSRSLRALRTWSCNPLTVPLTPPTIAFIEMYRTGLPNLFTGAG